ncbi:hypothetical protein ANI02nite_07840 [Acetobacter nitrogenifigens DSM 23921 = NBRC 105050]|uniref:Uncharacterized protein n=1 Tax=Acetobacter nitrogenifigens DSM 23921 = NBRC 105050 TaxID=1120919 RepID=A0A511X7I1_9PROT|nr:hypothetical protein ANI02nite_07840 [Acetobacter nitrogenifigens DSM 23921 = NBRC 105050]
MPQHFDRLFARGDVIHCETGAFHDLGDFPDRAHIVLNQQYTHFSTPRVTLINRYHLWLYVSKENSRKTCIKTSVW